MDAGTRHALTEETRAVVEGSGFEALRLTFGADGLLRLVLDHPTRRVTIDDTTRMNLRLRKALAARGFPVDDVRIEVESPGADRPLFAPRHYARFVGQRIRVVRRGGEVKDRVVIGLLSSADTASFRLTPEKGEPLLIAYADVAEARLDPKLPF
jgi:ribosome maturation factor RimP